MDVGSRMDTSLLPFDLSFYLHSLQADSSVLNFLKQVVCVHHRFEDQHPCVDLEVWPESCLVFWSTINLRVSPEFDLL